MPTPYYSLETTVFSIRWSKIDVNSMADLINYRVGVVRGVKHTELATVGHPDLLVCESSEKLFDQLLKGRIDIALTNRIDGIKSITKLDAGSFIVADEAIAKLDLYHYLHIGHEELVPTVNNTILDMKESGELEEIIANAEILTIKNID